MILPRIPYPLIKGDKLRAFHHIRELSKENTIILCALTSEKIHPEALPELKKYCTEVHIFKLNRIGIFINLIKAFLTGLPLQVGFFYNAKVKKSINKIIEQSQPDHIFCQLIRVAEYVKDVKKIEMTLDYQDVFSKGVERRMQIIPFIFKPIFKMEYKRLLNYERHVFERFTNKIIISEPDRDYIPHKEKEKIHIIPNGVDTGYYSPREVEKKYELLFTGNMAYPPNINAVLYIVHEIMPLLIKESPNIKLLISGANPSKSVMRLQSKNVHVSGWVRDIRNSYAQSRIFLAPMQIGTGLQNKLLEAMAMKLPCVSSALANMALNATTDKEILIGNNAEEYVKHITKLLNDESYSKKIASKGYEYVLNNYNWETLTQKIEKIIN